MNIRILQIRLRRQTQILDDYIQDPDYLTTKNHFNYGIFHFNQVSGDLKQFTKISDILAKKKKPSPQVVAKVEQPPQQKIVQKSEKEIHLEKLIGEVYSLLNEEAPQPIQKPKIKMNDITKNLCPIVQYQRAKTLVCSIKEKMRPEVKYI